MDPAREISAEIAKRLQASFGALTDGSPQVVQAEEAFRIVDATPSSARYVLDVRTQEWKVNYLRSQWARYGAAYGVKVRLIDRVKRTTVRESSCDYISKSEANPPDYDQLVADGAARIRTYMNTFTKRCIEDVWANLIPRGQAPQASSLSEGSLAAAPVSNDKSQARLVAPSNSAAPLLRPQDIAPNVVSTLPTATVSHQSARTTSVVPDSPPGVVSEASAAAHAPSEIIDAPQVASRYTIYLTKPNPKAFAVSDNGGAWMAWGESLNPTVKESIPERALRGCEERSRARCVLYSVNGNLVSGQGVDSKR